MRRHQDSTASGRGPPLGHGWSPPHYSPLPHIYGYHAPPTRGYGGLSADCGPFSPALSVLSSRYPHRRCDTTSTMSDRFSRAVTSPPRMPDPVVFNAGFTFRINEDRPKVYDHVKVDPASSVPHTQSFTLTKQIDRFLKKSDHSLDRYQNILQGKQLHPETVAPRQKSAPPPKPPRSGRSSESKESSRREGSTGSSNSMSLSLTGIMTPSLINSPPLSCASMATTAERHRRILSKVVANGIAKRKRQKEDLSSSTSSTSSSDDDFESDSGAHRTSSGLYERSDDTSAEISKLEDLSSGSDDEYFDVHPLPSFYCVPHRPPLEGNGLQKGDPKVPTQVGRGAGRILAPIQRSSIGVPSTIRTPIHSQSLPAVNKIIFPVKMGNTPPLPQGTETNVCQEMHPIKSHKKYPAPPPPASREPSFISVSSQSPRGSIDGSQIGKQCISLSVSGLSVNTLESYTPVRKPQRTPSLKKYPAPQPPSIPQGETITFTTNSLPRDHSRRNTFSETMQQRRSLTKTISENPIPGAKVVTERPGSPVPNSSTILPIRLKSDTHYKTEPDSHLTSQTPNQSQNSCYVSCETLLPTTNPIPLSADISKNSTCLQDSRINNLKPNADGEVIGGKHNIDVAVNESKEPLKLPSSYIVTKEKCSLTSTDKVLKGNQPIIIENGVIDGSPPFELPNVNENANKDLQTIISVENSLKSVKNDNILNSNEICDSNDKVNQQQPINGLYKKEKDFINDQTETSPVANIKKFEASELKSPNENILLTKDNLCDETLTNNSKNSEVTLLTKEDTEKANVLMKNTEDKELVTSNQMPTSNKVTLDVQETLSHSRQSSVSKDSISSRGSRANSVSSTNSENPDLQLPKYAVKKSKSSKLLALANKFECDDKSQSVKSNMNKGPNKLNRNKISGLANIFGGDVKTKEVGKLQSPYSKPFSPESSESEFSKKSINGIDVSKFGGVASQEEFRMAAKKPKIKFESKAKKVIESKSSSESTSVNSNVDIVPVSVPTIVSNGEVAKVESITSTPVDKNLDVINSTIKGVDADATKSSSSSKRRKPKKKLDTSEVKIENKSSTTVVDSNSNIAISEIKSDLVTDLVINAKAEQSEVDKKKESLKDKSIVNSPESENNGHIIKIHTISSASMDNVTHQPTVGLNLVQNTPNITNSETLPLLKGKVDILSNLISKNVSVELNTTMYEKVEPQILPSENLTDAIMNETKLSEYNGKSAVIGEVSTKKESNLAEAYNSMESSADPIKIKSLPEETKQIDASLTAEVHSIENIEPRHTENKSKSVSDLVQDKGDIQIKELNADTRTASTIPFIDASASTEPLCNAVQTNTVSTVFNSQIKNSDEGTPDRPIVNIDMKPAVINTEISSSVIKSKIIELPVNTEIMPITVNSEIVPSSPTVDVTEIAQTNINTEVPLNVANSKISPTVDHTKIEQMDVNNKIPSTLGQVEIAQNIINTEISQSVVNTDISQTVVNTEILPTIVNTEILVPVVNAEITHSVVNTEISPTVGHTEIAQIDVNTEMSQTVVNKEILPTVVNTEISQSVVNAEMSPTVVNKETLPTVVNTDISQSVVDAEMSPTVVTTEILPTVGYIEVAQTKANSEKTETNLNSENVPTTVHSEVAPSIVKIENVPIMVNAEIKPTFLVENSDKLPSVVVNTEIPETLANSEVLPTSLNTEIASTAVKNLEILPAVLNSVILPTVEKVEICLTATDKNEEKELTIINSDIASLGGHSNIAATDLPPEFVPAVVSSSVPIEIMSENKAVPLPLTSLETVKRDAPSLNLENTSDLPSLRYTISSMPDRVAAYPEQNIVKDENGEPSPVGLFQGMMNTLKHSLSKVMLNTSQQVVSDDRMSADSQDKAVDISNLESYPTANKLYTSPISSSPEYHSANSSTHTVHSLDLDAVKHDLDNKIIVTEETGARSKRSSKVVIPDEVLNVSEILREAEERLTKALEKDPLVYRYPIGKTEEAYVDAFDPSQFDILMPLPVAEDMNLLDRRSRSSTPYREGLDRRSPTPKRIVEQTEAILSETDRILRKTRSHNSLRRSFTRSMSGMNLNRLTEVTADLTEEHSTSHLAGERIEAEQAERMRLEKEVNELQTEVKRMTDTNDKLEMERLALRTEMLHVELNGDIHDSDDAAEAALYKRKYEWSLRELEVLKKQLKQQQEDDLDQLLVLKKQLEKKILDSHEETEEQRQVATQLKKKSQRLQAEMNDMKILLEEQTSRNNLLEKKQRKFDQDVHLVQEELRNEKLTKDKIQREKDQIFSEKYSFEQEVATLKLELELKDEKVAALTREINDLNFTGKAEEEVAILKKAKHDLELRVKDQEEELDDLAGQVQMLEGARLRLEMSLEQMRKENRKEAQQREEEMEEVRLSAQKKVKAFEAQLEAEHDERTQLLREKHELERRLALVQERTYASVDEDAFHKVKKELKKTKALLKDTQTMLEKTQSEGSSKLLLRQLKTQLEDAEFAKTAAIKARQSAESEVSEVQSQLEEALRAKNDAEERCVRHIKEKTEMQTQLEEGEEEVAEVMKKYKATVSQLSIDQINISEQAQMIAELEHEKQVLQERLTELSSKVEVLEGETANIHTQRRLQMKIKELESKLELESTTRQRLDSQITRLKDQLERLCSECDSAKAKEAQALDFGKKLNRQLREAKEDLSNIQQKQTDAISKKQEVEKQYELAESEIITLKSDLKLAFKRIEDLQQALQGDLSDSDSELTDSKMMDLMVCSPTNDLLMSSIREDMEDDYKESFA